MLDFVWSKTYFGPEMIGMLKSKGKSISLVLWLRYLGRQTRSPQFRETARFETCPFSVLAIHEARGDHAPVYKK